MQDRFPSLVEHLPLREQDEPPWLVLDGVPVAAGQFPTFST